MNFVKGSGGKPVLNMTASGTFDVSPAGFPKTHIKYVPLGISAELKDFAQITGEWIIMHNYSHTKAILKFQKNSSPCLDFFSDEQKAKIYDYYKSNAKDLQDLANEKEQARAKDDDSVAGSAGEEAAAAAGSQASASRPAPPPAASRMRKRYKHSS